MTRYVLVEGMDGVGKSTLIERLKTLYPGFDVMDGTRGVCEVGLAWRSYMRERVLDIPDVVMGSVFQSIQRNMFEYIDSLPDDKVVILDRAFISTAIYQSRNAEDVKLYLEYAAKHFPKPLLVVDIRRSKSLRDPTVLNHFELVDTTTQDRYHSHYELVWDTLPLVYDDLRVVTINNDGDDEEDLDNLVHDLFNNIMMELQYVN